MLWELCTREDFFGEVNFMSAIEDNVRRGKRPPIPTSIPSEFQELIALCWAQKPDQRPTFSDSVTRLSVLILKLHPDLGMIALSEENRQVAAKSQENHFLKLTTSRSQRGLDTLASISISTSPPTKPVLGMPVPLSSSPSPGSNISPRGLFAASPGTTSRRNLLLIGSDRTRKAQPQRAVPQRILLHDAQARAKEAYKDRPQEFQEITSRLPAGVTFLLSTNYVEAGVSIAEVWCGCSNGQIVIFDSVYQTLLLLFSNDLFRLLLSLITSLFYRRGKNDHYQLTPRVCWR
jgi:hypothetical protein